ncbi:hypothetical protein [Plantibacter sp. YIM 135347]|uniref:hypothetical protein n=1 Tax=Plantibacter sp. YIM 135347 TaxID=3423919 RepID=UPI003D328B6D
MITGGLITLASGAGVGIAVAFLVVLTIVMRRRHVGRNAERLLVTDPEAARAAADIQSQIDRGRGLY